MRSFLSVFEGSLAIVMGLIYFHPDHISNRFHPSAVEKKFFSPSTRGPKWGWQGKKCIYLKIWPFVLIFSRIFPQHQLKMIDFVVFHEVLPILSHFTQDVQLLRKILQQKSSKWAIFVKSGQIWHICDFLAYLKACRKRTTQAVILKNFRLIHPDIYHRSWADKPLKKSHW